MLRRDNNRLFNKQKDNLARITLNRPEVKSPSVSDNHETKAARPLPRPVIWLGFGLLLGLALGLRVYGINFGLPQLYYWDEPTVVQRAIRFGSGDLNPHFFYYPALYIYVTFLVSGVYFVFNFITGQFKTIQDFGAQYFIDPSGVYFSARLMTALVGTTCVVLTYWVGKRYFGALVGYLGALFLAVAVVQASFSHIALTDVPQSLFIIIAYLFLYRVMQQGRWQDYLLCGLVIGLGAATKYLAILLISTLFLAHYYNGNPGFNFTRKWPRSLGQWFSPKLLAAGGALFLGFFVGTPFNILNFGAFVKDFQAQAELSGASFYGLLTALTNSLPGSLGWPLFLLSLGGVITLIRERKRLNWLFLSFPLVYLLFVGRSSIWFSRYIIPLEPFLTLAAAYFLVTMYWRIRAWVKNEKLVYAGFVVVILGLIAAPLYTNMRWDMVMAHETDSRTEALAWVEQTIPAGTVVAIQSLYGRTYYNVPLMTDKKLVEIDGYIPRSHSFDPVRERVATALNKRPVYQEVAFVYNFETLKAAGVKYIFISDQNWPDILAGIAAKDDPGWQFKADLETKAELVKQVAPKSNLDKEVPSGGLVLLPQLPPELKIYRIK